MRLPVYLTPIFLVMSLLVTSLLTGCSGRGGVGLNWNPLNWRQNRPQLASTENVGSVDSLAVNRAAPAPNVQVGALTCEVCQQRHDLLLNGKCVQCVARKPVNPDLGIVDKLPLKRVGPEENLDQGVAPKTVQFDGRIHFGNVNAPATGGTSALAEKSKPNGPKNRNKQVSTSLEPKNGGGSFVPVPPKSFGETKKAPDASSPSTSKMLSPIDVPMSALPSENSLEESAVSEVLVPNSAVIDAELPDPKFEIFQLEDLFVVPDSPAELLPSTPDDRVDNILNFHPEQAMSELMLELTRDLPPAQETPQKQPSPVGTSGNDNQVLSSSQDGVTLIANPVANYHQLRKQALSNHPQNGGAHQLPRYPQTPQLNVRPVSSGMNRRILAPREFRPLPKMNDPSSISSASRLNDEISRDVFKPRAFAEPRTTDLPTPIVLRATPRSNGKDGNQSSSGSGSSKARFLPDDSPRSTEQD